MEIEGAKAEPRRKVRIPISIWKPVIENAVAITVISLVLFGMWMWADHVIGDVRHHYGNDFEFKTNSYFRLEIEAEEVSIAAWSEEDFSMVHEGGTVIFGQKEPPPEGWEFEKSPYSFFTHDRVTVPGGNWQVSESQDVTVHVVSETPVEVREVKVDRVNDTWRGVWIVLLSVIWLFSFYVFVIYPLWAYATKEA